jgi:prepilin-type N-terminal cleavage/methylation domain-containing protein
MSECKVRPPLNHGIARKRGTTLIELVVVSVLVGLLTSIGVVVAIKMKTTAIQHQVAILVDHLDEVRIKLQTTRNVGQLGIPATNELIWDPAADFTFSYDAAGVLSSTTDEDIAYSIDRYMLKDQNIGGILRDMVDKGILPRIKTPLDVADFTNSGALFTLTYDVSRGVWIAEN